MTTSRQWYYAQLRWAEMVEGKQGLRAWKEAAHIFLSEDEQTAFPQALEIGRPVSYTHLDYAQAVYWYRKAADQGNAAAQNSLGFMYVNGRGGLAQDDVQAVYWYRKAADQGNAEAQTNLGVM